MQCFRCQNFEHTQQQCACSFVCGICCKSEHDEAPCSYPPHCIDSPDCMNLVTALQELGVKGTFHF
jgi:hypothetical protein